MPHAKRVDWHFVKRGVDQARETGETFDLSGRNLDGLNFWRFDFGDINLADASLRGANLIECDLTDADLCGANLEGANLVGANLEGVPLQDAVLNEANLQHTNLGKARLEQAKLIKADLRQANLSCACLEDAILRDANLRGADLTQARLQHADLEGANLESATLSHTVLSRDSLGEKLLQERNQEYSKAKYVYLALKENFQDIGDYDAASWAYVKERTVACRTYWPGHAHRFYFEREVPGDLSGFRLKLWNIMFYLRYSRRWLGSFLLGAFTGYGEKPTNALYLAIVAVAGYTLAYAGFGGIMSAPERTLTWSDYFLYSLGAFCTMTFSDLEASTDLTKALTSSEAIVGVVCLAVFTAAVSQRIGSR